MGVACVTLVFAESNISESWNIVFLKISAQSPRLEKRKFKHESWYEGSL